MPKMKVHSGAKKRIKVTGTAKLVRRSAGKAHLNEHKPRKQKRRLSNEATIVGGEARKIRQLLGN